MANRNILCSQSENPLNEQFDLVPAFVAGSGETELNSNVNSLSSGAEYGENRAAANTSFATSGMPQARDSDENHVVSALGKLGLKDCGGSRTTGGSSEKGDREHVSIENLMTLVRALQDENAELKSKVEFLEEIGRINAKPPVDNEALRQEVGDLRAQVANLEVAKGRICEKSGELASERDVLRDQLNGKVVIESQLREAKSKLSKELASSKEQCTALQTDCGHLRTFALLGALVRNRFLEWEHKRTSQNEVLIDAGNSTAHYGRCYADAMLYTDNITSLLPEVKARYDNDVYRNLYGIDPAMMLKYRENQKLMEAFDLRCTMKRFLIPETYETSRFKAYWTEAWAKIKTREDMTVEGLKELVEKPEMQILWSRMKEEHDIADTHNKKKRLEAKLEARRANR